MLSLALIAGLLAHALKRKQPEHALLRLVVDVTRGQHTPVAHVLPAPDRQFVEERDTVAAFDGRQQSAIARTQILIAATALARVIDDIARLALPVRITGIDPPEVRQERDQSPFALIDAALYAMRAIDFGPRQHTAFRCLIAHRPIVYVKGRASFPDCFSRAHLHRESVCVSAPSSALFFADQNICMVSVADNLL